MRIAVDAGHGQQDIGMNTSDGKKESDVTLELASKIQDNLKDHAVILVRGHNEYLTLQERQKILLDRAADISISLHLEYNSDQFNRFGVGVYHYFKDREAGRVGRVLASGLQRLLVNQKARSYSSNFFLVRKQPLSFVLRLPYLLKVPVSRLDIEMIRFCNALGGALKTLEYKP